MVPDSVAVGAQQIYLGQLTEQSTNPDRPRFSLRDIEFLQGRIAVMEDEDSAVRLPTI